MLTVIKEQIKTKNNIGTDSVNLEQIHRVYFVGIGGIGMSALARYFHAIGKEVAGYDKTPTEITKRLEELGMEIHYDDDLALVSDSFKAVDHTLVVYTPAIPKDHKELCYFQQGDFHVIKRAAVLGLITKNTFCFAVAGTHGKTTTSSILGHLLKVCNADMTAFLGGITENYKSNLILNGAAMSVVEADEFDRSFLQLSPDMACITSMDADHLDIYEQKEALEESFEAFAQKLPEGNKLFVRYGLPVQGITYGVEAEADYCIQNLKISDGGYRFDIKTPKALVRNVVFYLPGTHNMLNALVAFAMAYEYGFDVELLKQGLASFTGVERRFSYKIRREDLIVIDDYAHHPTEINAVYEAVKEMYPEARIMTVFQPHLFSRTRDFIDDFAASLSQFDVVRLLDIYPARELPIEGVTSEWLLNKMSDTDKKVIDKSAIVNEISAAKAKVVLLLGAGDIGVEVEQVVKALKIES